MTRQGFEEEPATFEAESGPDIVGQFRRFGQSGPAYEIIKVDANGDTHVVVFKSGEAVVVSLEDVLLDPMAETIP